MVDPLNDFTKVSSKTANWTTDTTNVTFFSGDTSRATRTVDDTEDLVYALPSISSFQENVWSFSTNITGVTTWYSTNNGSSYTQIATTAAGPYMGSAGWRMYVLTPSASLPAGVTNLEFQFTSGTGNAWDPQLGQMQISYSGSAPTCSASPSTPTGLAASGTTSTSTNLTWSAVTPPANCSISSYTVFKNGTSIGTATGTSFAVTGLTASTTYTFTVAATDSFGTSAQSTGLSVTTSAGSCAASPSAPTGLVASGTTTTSTNLNWSAVTPPANCSVTSYTVFKNGTSIGTATGTSFADTGLTASTIYTFTVAATDSFGTSAQGSWTERHDFGCKLRRVAERADRPGRVGHDQHVDQPDLERGNAAGELQRVELHGLQERDVDRHRDGDLVRGHRPDGVDDLHLHGGGHRLVRRLRAELRQASRLPRQAAVAASRSPAATARSLRSLLTSTSVAAPPPVAPRRRST